MGLLDKVKNLFTEEVEEPVVKKEEPKKVIEKKHEPIREIQKQERRVEIAPARRETIKLLDDEIEKPSIEPIIKKEEKPSVPIYFSDEDFEDLEKPKVVKREDRIASIKEVYQGKKEEKKEEKKYFKPSPIISPVYGILDKNYTKEDITTKDVPRTSYRSDKITVDDIRNKAYGTLEDELENSLLIEPLLKEEKKDEDISIDIFEELETRESKNKKIDLLQNDFEIEEKQNDDDLTAELEKQKQKIEEINEIIKNNLNAEKKKETSKKIDNILEELDEIEELIPETKKDEEIVEENKEDLVEEEPVIEEKIIKEEPIEETVEEEPIEEENTNEEIEDNKDEIEESDLFNLIDSMYEKRDE